MIIEWKTEKKNLAEALKEAGITDELVHTLEGGGYSIDFKKAPTAEQLLLLNKAFSGYKRDYSVVPPKEGESRDLEKEVDKLKAKVSKLEKNVK